MQHNQTRTAKMGNRTTIPAETGKSIRLNEQLPPPVLHYSSGFPAWMINSTFLFATESNSPCFHDKLYEVKGFDRCSNKQTCEWTLFSEWGQMKEHLDRTKNQSDCMNRWYALSPKMEWVIPTFPHDSDEGFPCENLVFPNKLPAQIQFAPSP